MTPKATSWDELHFRENPAGELLEYLGFTYVTLDDLEREQAGFKEPILTAGLNLALRTNRTKAVRSVTQVRAVSLGIGP